MRKYCLLSVGSPSSLAALKPSPCQLQIMQFRQFMNVRQEKFSKKLLMGLKPPASVQKTQAAKFYILFQLSHQKAEMF